MKNPWRNAGSNRKLDLAATNSRTTLVEDDHGKIETFETTAGCDTDPAYAAILSHGTTGNAGATNRTRLEISRCR